MLRFEARSTTDSHEPQVLVRGSQACPRLLSLPFCLPLSLSALLPLVCPYGVVALALVPARSESNTSMGQHDNARVYGGPNAAGDSSEAIDRVHALQLDAGRQEERTMQAALRPISFDMSENGRQVIRVCVCVCVCV